MKNQKLAVFFAFKFDGANVTRRPHPIREMAFSANVTPDRIVWIRRMAHVLRSWKGVSTVSFSIVEEIRRAYHRTKPSRKAA
jgi:hypothetical protein